MSADYEIAELQCRVADLFSRLADAQTQLERTREVLAAIVEQVNDYERVNNLAPKPGRTECWDSVARAKLILSDEASK